MVAGAGMESEGGGSGGAGSSLSIRRKDMLSNERRKSDGCEESRRAHARQREREMRVRRTESFATYTSFPEFELGT